MREEVRESPSGRWFWIVAIWSGVGLFDATQNVVVMRAQGMQHAWTRLFLLLAFSWLPWVLATPLVLRTGARFPFRTLREGSAVALGRHAATWLVVSLGAAFWMACLESLLNPWNPAAPPQAIVPLFLQKIQYQLLSSLVLYYCILMAGYALASRERLARERMESAQLAEQLARAQLDALRHQLEPHFLFNALNAVTGLVREGNNDKAVETLARVSEFLRHTLHESGAHEVPLADELKFATMYLDIQQIRFADRLLVRTAIAPGLERAAVPRLILQPIVENAIEHGIATRAQPGTIEIAAVKAGARLVLTVYNDGPSLATEAPAGDASIGLANVRNRLRGLHGGAATLDIANVDRRGVRVSMSIPFRETP